MNRTRLFGVALCIVILVLGIGVVVWRGQANGSVMPSPTATPSVIPSATPTPTATPTATPTPTPNTSLYYPMTRYAERITNRGYGKAITAADSSVLPCGSPFEGFHTGDDLEVTSEELDADMPVYAVAAGRVRQVGAVGGYGGLIVIEHTINNQVMTAYYGHIDLNKTSVEEGDSVTPGQRITSLGANCSSQTSVERKHLHFALHKGTAIDVKGYVTSQSLLQSWVNPIELLTQLQAQLPT